MINTIGIALTGLNSASLRINSSAANIANVSTAGSLNDTSTPPYTPTTTQNKAQGALGGVQTDIVPKGNPFTQSFDPDSPFANEEGIVGIPNVNLAEEVVNVKIAALSYEANLSTIKVAGELFDELLDTI